MTDELVVEAGGDVEVENVEEEVEDDAKVDGGGGGEDAADFFRAPFRRDISWKYKSCVKPSWPAVWISSKVFFQRGESSGSNRAMSGSCTNGRELLPHGAPRARHASKRSAVLHRACSDISVNTRSR